MIIEIPYGLTGINNKNNFKIFNMIGLLTTIVKHSVFADV